MNDMAPVIVPKSDQISADDLIAGPRTVVIRGVDIQPGTEQPVTIGFEGDEGRPWKPCKSMSRVLVNAWGPDAGKYIGRSVTLFRDPSVTWGGLAVGGIRISHMSDIDETLQMALTATRGKRKPYIVKPLANAPAPKKDKAAEGVEALLERINAGEDVTADAQVKKQIAWLEKNRPELAEKVNTALAALNDDDPFSEQAGDAEPEEAQTASPADDLLASFASRIETAKDAATLDAIAAEIERSSDKLDEDDLKGLDSAVAAKRRKVK